VVRHRTDDAGDDVDLVDVAVGLLEKEDRLAVVRPVGALAEVRQATDVAGVFRVGPAGIGCRGRDAMGTLLLGSTAEEIIENATVPVIVVKKKGVGAGFLDALLRS